MLCAINIEPHAARCQMTKNMIIITSRIRVGFQQNERRACDSYIVCPADVWAGFSQAFLLGRPTLALLFFSLTAVGVKYDCYNGTRAQVLARCLGWVLGFFVLFPCYWVTSSGSSCGCRRSVFRLLIVLLCLQNCKAFSDCWSHCNIIRVPPASRDHTHYNTSKSVDWRPPSRQG